jgi:hypothetical protein
MFFTSRHIQPLTNDQIMHKAPAVFAERPHTQTSYGKSSSNSYLFLPTIKLVEGLRSNGWEVVSAVQSGNQSSSAEAKMTNKHALFFARSDVFGRSFDVGETLPLVKLENSHNGLSSFALSTGFFRKACANGLTVPESLYSAPKVKHTLNLRDDVIEATYKVMNDFPMLMDMQKSLGALNLTREEIMLLGDVASDVFFTSEERQGMQETARKSFNGDRYLIGNQLTASRRYEDRKTDLWTVTNVIQENLIRGNVQVLNSDRRLAHKRKVTSLDRDREIHEKLFKITQHFAREKGLNLGVSA